MATRFQLCDRTMEGRFGQTLCAAVGIHAAAFAVMTSGVPATSMAGAQAPSGAAMHAETVLAEVELEPLGSGEQDPLQQDKDSTAQRAVPGESDPLDSFAPTQIDPQGSAGSQLASPPSQLPVAASVGDAQHTVVTTHSVAPTHSVASTHSVAPPAPHVSSKRSLHASSDGLTPNSIKNLAGGSAKQGGAPAPGLGRRTAASGGSRAGSAAPLTPRLLAATYRCSDLFPYDAKTDSQDLTLDLDVEPAGTARVRRVREAHQVEFHFVLAARSCARRLRFAPAKDESGQATQGRATLRLHFSRHRADG